MRGRIRAVAVNSCGFRCAVWRPIRELRWGRWTLYDSPGRAARPMRSCSTWHAFRVGGSVRRRAAAAAGRAAPRLTVGAGCRQPRCGRAHSQPAAQLAVYPPRPAKEMFSAGFRTAWSSARSRATAANWRSPSPANCSTGCALQPRSSGGLARAYAGWCRLRRGRPPPRRSGVWVARAKGR